MSFLFKNDWDKISRQSALTAFKLIIKKKNNKLHVICGLKLSLRKQEEKKQE